MRKGRKANGSRISGTEMAGLPGCRVSAPGDRKEQRPVAWTRCSAYAKWSVLLGALAIGFVTTLIISADAQTYSTYFSDNFDREADTFEPPWDWMDRAYTDRLTTSSEVVRKGTHSARMTVEDGDVYPRTSTEDPRAQLNSPEIFKEGDERYIGWSTYYPTDFPAIPGGTGGGCTVCGTQGWFIDSELGFAEPWTGGGPIRTMIHTNDEVSIARDENYNYDKIWTGTLQRGVWVDHVFHMKFSTDETIGFVEYWRNGVQQTFNNGQTRFYTKTLDPNHTAPGIVTVKNYRKKGMFRWATLYHDEVKVGNSYAAVSITPDMGIMALMQGRSRCPDLP